MEAEHVEGVLERMRGATIEEAEADIPIVAGELYDRMRGIRLKVSGVGWVRIDYWADHEEDGSLEIEVE